MDKSKFNDKKELRNFGLGLGISLCLIGTFRLITHREFYWYFYISGIVIFSSGLIFPILLKPFFILFSYIGLGIGWFTNRVVLTVLFYFLFTPFGYLLKLFGKDFLNLKISKEAKSYWIKRENTKFEKSSYETQF